MFRIIILAGMTATSAGLCYAQDLPPLRPLSMPDPLRAASLPFDLTQPPEVDDGQWNVSAGWAWFNTWSTVWEVTQVHRDFGMDDTTVPSPAEFRALENQYPSDPFNYIDLEGNIFELLVTRGLPGGWSAEIRVPWLTVGEPNWDSFIDGWHDLFGLTDSHRNTFPRGEALLYIPGREGVIEERELARSGLGDISLTIATPRLDILGGHHRAMLAVEMPTGKTGTLQGSGGWDLGLRTQSIWNWRPSRLLVGLGLNHLDDSGDFLGISRTDTWYVGTSYEHRLWRRWTLSGAVTLESSPLADFTDGEAGEPALYRMLALSFDIKPGWLAELQYGTNWEGIGISPDASFRLVVCCSH